MSNPTQTIPGYQILRKLGSGGMGMVFLAQDIKSCQRQTSSRRDLPRARQQHEVALKILYPKTIKNQALLTRFVHEAQLLIKFQHPNIVKGYRYGNFKGLYFLAMEYIKGESAQAIIDREGVVQEDLAQRIILQTADALDYMERQGVLHGDIKPDNLLLTGDHIVKLCDLSFAQPIAGPDTQGSSDLTSGTPQYMSPEQAQGQINLDIRSDIYSLGATLYHLVTGKLPFQGAGNLEIMAQQVLADLQSNEIKNRRLSPLTLYFIEKMMAKEKEIRYQSPGEVKEDMQAQIKGFKRLTYQAEETPPPASAPPKVKRPPVRSKLGEILKKTKKKPRF